MQDIFGNNIFEEKRTMSNYFGVAPFSVLNTVDGIWQKRKREWNSLINDNGNTREATLFSKSNNKNSIVSKKIEKINNGVSILDAVLAELMIKWFTEIEFKTFDPFAGDTVFGYVSGYLKRPFTGIELRQEQVDFNQLQCNTNNLPCKYICDSGENMDTHIKDNSVDFIFSCPPYADLEKYSDLKDDLSNMSHNDFFKMLKKILQNAYKKLKDNRFAVIVIGEVRDKNGAYIQLVPKVIRYMTNVGYLYYNEIILINSAGTLPLRAGKSMNSGRKIGKRHQNVLVFYKGDPKEIKNNFTVLMPKNEYYK